MGRGTLNKLDWPRGQLRYKKGTRKELDRKPREENNEWSTGNRRGGMEDREEEEEDEEGRKGQVATSSVATQVRPGRLAEVAAFHSSVSGRPRW